MPMKDICGKFINIEEGDKEYYHIYYNDKKEEEIKSTYLNKKDKVSKINIIIDYHVKSFSNIFHYSETINFKKFYRNNITDMSYMFNGCSSLRELNLSNFNTNYVTNMSLIFFGCQSLKELNLSNFNTNNVTDMRYMFNRCSDKLKLKIKSKFKIFKEEAFEDY